MAIIIIIEAMPEDINYIKGRLSGRQARQL